MSVTRYTVAIAGNPNSGKTSIFNALAGTRQHVGNYPGVTVERKEGGFRHRGFVFDVVDLPGTYGLSAASLDEKVARDFIIRRRPDVVVDIVDASNFERHAYLTSQLVELGVRLVLVLNMSDRARAQGQELDLEMIQERLGCQVVETVGSKGQGVRELKEAILRAAQGETREIELDYGSEISQAIDDVLSSISAAGSHHLSPYSDRWVAIKLLEDDLEAQKLVIKRYGAGAKEILDRAGGHRRRMGGHHGDDLPVLITERRFGFAAGLYREVVRREPLERRHLSDKLDDIVTHRLLGIPLFLGIMYLLFYVTFTVGEIPMRLIEAGQGWLAGFLSASWPGQGLLKSLVIDGIIGGVGGVVVFLPNIVLLFMCISLLEDTGYMARASFIVDRLMHKIGLHGKSFIPMVIGFGCSVPAIMATRTLEHRRDRLATMMVIPLMSCGARLPIYALIIPAFFPPEWRARVLWLIYLTGVLLALGIVRLLRSTLLRGDSAPFVMELPPYRLPTVKGIIIHMWQRSWMYLRKAGTIILAISVIMWALTSFPKLPPHVSGDVQVRESVAASQEQGTRAAAELQYSFAGRVGRALEPVLKPLGFDWRTSTALIGAFAAKEVFVAQLGIIFSLGEADEHSLSLREKLRQNYSPLVGLCIMLFCLIAAPCMATVAVVRRESGSWRYALVQFFGLTALAYIVTLLVYQVGGLILS